MSAPQARRVGGVPGSCARRTLASRARTQPTKAVETPPRDSNLQGARDATISPSSYVQDAARSRLMMQTPLSVATLHSLFVLKNTFFS